MGSSGTSPGWLAAEARLADIISPPNDRKGDNHTGLRWWFCMAANKTTECHDMDFSCNHHTVTRKISICCKDRECIALTG